MNPAVGILVAIAVISHDFTDGMNTVTLMLSNKNSTEAAKTFLFFDALAPVLGVLAVLGTFGMLVIVLWTHSFARVMGPLWVLAWVLYYLWYRYKTKRPLLGNLPHDWEAHQLEILADTGEWELYERYKIKVERRRRAENVPSGKEPR